MFFSGKRKLVLFTVDTSFYQSGKCHQLVIQSKLNRMTNWFAYNILSSITSKCETISLCGEADNIVMPDKAHCKCIGIHLLVPYTQNPIKLNYVAKFWTKSADWSTEYVICIQPKKQCLLQFFICYIIFVMNYSWIIIGNAQRRNLEVTDQITEYFLE